MKKLFFIPLLGVASVAGAWQDRGHLVPLSDHNYRCDSGNSICVESVDPGLNAPAAGQKVILHTPTQNIVGTIVAVKSSSTGEPVENPPLPSNGAVEYQVNVIQAP